MDRYLENVYFDPKHPASYSSPFKLYKAAQADGRHYTIQQIKNWLARQESYTLHKPLSRTFDRNKVVVSGIDDQWDADLIDFSRLSKFNNGISYILVCIDILSRYVWMRPLESKSGEDVAKAFNSIFYKGRRPKYLRTDKGQEFKAKKVQKIFLKYNVHHFVTQNEPKANFSERVIKTLKSKIFRYFTQKQTYNFIKILPEMAKSYNKTYHRSIGMTPSDVDDENETALWWKLYWPYLSQSTNQKYKFDVGDYVRVTYLRNPFTREYDHKWSGEIFKISQRFKRKGIPVYRLIDFKDTDIEGTFYQQELQQVKDNELWKVEKIIKRRGRGQNKEVFVKWLYWPKKCNEWIKESDLVDV